MTALRWSRGMDDLGTTCAAALIGTSTVEARSARDAAMRWFDAEHHTAAALQKVADDAAGRYEEAVSMFERAIEIFHAQDNSHHRAGSLDRLGDTWHAVVQAKSACN